MNALYTNLFEAKGFSYSVEFSEISSDYVLKIEQPFYTAGALVTALKNYQYAHDNIKHPYSIPKIKKVIFNGPATIVFWADDTKTVVKMSEEELNYDYEKGFAFAVLRKLFGNMYNRQLKKVDEAYQKDIQSDDDGNGLNVLIGFLKPDQL